MRRRTVRSAAFVGGRSDPSRSHVDKAGISPFVPRGTTKAKTGQSLGGYAAAEELLPPSPDYLTPLFGLTLVSDQDAPNASAVLALMAAAPSLARLAGPGGSLGLENKPVLRLKPSARERMRF